MHIWWDETDKPWDYDCGIVSDPGILQVYVFNWERWRWGRYFGKSPVTAHASPSEHASFWAGVLDILLHEQGLPDWFMPGEVNDHIIPWKKSERPGFIQIGLIRTHCYISNEPPEWFDDRPSRMERLLGNTF